MTIQEYMTANKEQVIDTINDAVRFTKTNLKEVSSILVGLNEQFQLLITTEKADKYNSIEEKAFGKILSIVVEDLILGKLGKDNFEDWNQSNIDRAKRTHL